MVITGGASVGGIEEEFALLGKLMILRVPFSFLVIYYYYAHFRNYTIKNQIWKKIVFIWG